MSAQVFTLLFGLPFLWVLYQTRQAQPAAPAVARAPLMLLGVLGFGLLLRLPLLWDPGFHYDIGTYKAWALKLSDPAAPLQIYTPGYFADYPPLYMYVLGALGWLARSFGLESSSHFTALIKLPGLLADLAVTWLIWRQARHTLSLSSAAWVAGLYWLNPAIAFDTALWGQTDALLAVLLVLAWRAWSLERLWLSSLLLGAAVAFKPQGLIFAYVYGLALLLHRPFGSTLKQAAIGLGSFALIIWPFAREQSLDWIFRLYFSTAETYDYLTVNAYNFWAAWGLNWSRGEATLLGLDLQRWAILLAGGALSAVAWHTARLLRVAASQTARQAAIGWAFALAAMLFFMLAPRMHERYILSLLPMLLLLSLGQPRLHWLMALWSATALVNLAYVFHYYVGLDKVAPADTGVVRAVAITNVLAMVLTLLARLRPQWLERAGGGLTQAYRQLPTMDLAPTTRQHFSWRHAASLILFFGTALGIGCIGLGTLNYPTSGVAPGAQSIQLRFRDPVSPATALIYAGEGQATFRLEQQDGPSWRPLVPDTEIKTFYQLYEIELPADQPGQLFRIVLSGQKVSLRINEIGLLDAAGQPLIPDAILPRREDLARLFDEPQTWIAGRGYLASTFFDEIYHGRTAYEYLERHAIYETTHPPLGKWLISQGIATFGMNPFGMRIAGVIATALTVAALAWGAWLLAGSLRALWLSGLLGLFEFSRFSIGRYATIDPFLILLLLLAALFLWRSFCRPNLGQVLNGWRLGPDLLLAGALLGLAIAVKWSALYFGMGVFAWFIYSLIRRWRESQGPTLARMAISAALAFGLLPALIYYHSYLPFMRCLPDTPALWSLQGLREFWASQTYMMGYHSGLKDSHAFASAWYTWPLLLKPLWLYRNEHLDGLRSSITLLGNPLLCWTGLLALAAVATGKLAWPDRDRAWLLAVIGSLFLPWLAVSRVSFIYHYYPVVPFLLLILGVSLARWPVSRGPWRHLPMAMVALSGLLFVWFFPAISGLPVAPAWSESLRWLPGWWML